MRNTRLALGLYTTTPVLEIGLGVLESEEEISLLVDSSWSIGKETSRLIHLHLQEVMHGYSWWDLVYIAVGAGVGSFTGTRVGMVLARTMGQQLKIPVYAIDCQEIRNNAYSTSSAVSQLLTVAQKRWYANDRSSWQEALPIYSA